MSMTRRESAGKAWPTRSRTTSWSAIGSGLPFARPASSRAVVTNRSMVAVNSLVIAMIAVARALLGSRSPSDRSRICACRRSATSGVRRSCETCRSSSSCCARSFANAATPSSGIDVIRRSRPGLRHRRPPGARRLDSRAPTARHCVVPPAETSASTCSSSSMLGGFAICRSKPASRARRRSSGPAYPVRAMSETPLSAASARMARARSYPSISGRPMSQMHDLGVILASLEQAGVAVVGDHGIVTGQLERLLQAVGGVLVVLDDEDALLPGSRPGRRPGARLVRPSRVEGQRHREACASPRARG